MAAGRIAAVTIRERTKRNAIAYSFAVDTATNLSKSTAANANQRGTARDSRPTSGAVSNGRERLDASSRTPLIELRAGNSLSSNYWESVSS